MCLMLQVAVLSSAKCRQKLLCSCRSGNTLSTVSAASMFFVDEKNGSKFPILKHDLKCEALRPQPRCSPFLTSICCKAHHRASLSQVKKISQARAPTVSQSVTNQHRLANSIQANIRNLFHQDIRIVSHPTASFPDVYRTAVCVWPAIHPRSEHSDATTALRGDVMYLR